MKRKGHLLICNRITKSEATNMYDSSISAIKLYNIDDFTTPSPELDEEIKEFFNDPDMPLMMITLQYASYIIEGDINKLINIVSDYEQETRQHGFSAN